MAYHKLLSQSVEEKTESKSFFSYYKKDSPKLKSMHTRIQKKKKNYNEATSSKPSNI